MAKPKTKGRKEKSPAKNSSNWMLLGGIAVAIIAIIAVGVMLINQPRQAATAENGSEANASVATPADRTERYLGPETDPQELALAAQGKIGVPTVAFFHAEW